MRLRQEAVREAEAALADRAASAEQAFREVEKRRRAAEASAAASEEEAHRAEGEVCTVCVCLCVRERVSVCACVLCVCYTCVISLRETMKQSLRSSSHFLIVCCHNRVFCVFVLCVV